MTRAGRFSARRFILMILAVAGIGLGVWPVAIRTSRNLQAKAAPEETSQPTVPVFAASAEARDVPIIVRGIGSVQAFNTVTVKSRVDGNIVNVAFREGQYVKSGDLLVQVDPRPYRAQLEQAEANKGKDQANLENARRDLARDAAILKDRLAVSQQQYDTQKSLVDQLTAAVQADQAQIDTANLNLAYSSVSSPIDGVTGMRLVDIGNLVQASAATPLVVVTQIRPIYVTFTIPERDLDQTRAAMTQRPLEVLAFSGDDSRQLSKGVVKVVNNQVDPATGTVTLKAEFANQDAALWPGEFVNVHLVLDVVKNGVTVPAGAVQMGPTGPFVYVVSDKSTAQVRPLSVTQVENNTALIGKGLAAGERIVVSGQANLSPGVKVAIEQGTPGEMNARQPEIGPQGVGSTGVTTGLPGTSGVNPR